MAGRAKAGCGANLVEHSRSLNGSGSISFRLQANCSLFGAATIVHAARLNVSIPGVDREVGEGLLAEAETLCPYSKATRGNIDVAINLV
jgi:lipoyl-dependent peroxiredoxin